MGIGDDVEIAAGQCRGKLAGGGLVRRADVATAPAVGGPEAVGPPSHSIGGKFLGGGIIGEQFLRRVFPVLQFRQHRPVDRHDRHAHFLRVLLREQFRRATLGGRQQHTLRRIGGVFHSFVGAVDTDEQFGFRVVRFEFFVGDRPIKPQPVARTRLEIVRPVPQRDAPPMVRSPAEHARPPPFEFLLRFGVGVGVRLPGNLPSTIHGGIKKSERLVRGCIAHQRGLIVGVEHRRFVQHIVTASRLQHHALKPGKGERVSGLPPTGTGTDDHHVIFIFRLIGGNHGHRSKPPKLCTEILTECLKGRTEHYAVCVSWDCAAAKSTPP